MKILSIIFLFLAILAVYSCDDSYGLDSNVIEKDITKELARDTAVYVISQYEIDNFECQVNYYWTVDNSGNPQDTLLIQDNWNETAHTIEMILMEYREDGKVESFEIAFSGGHEIDYIIKTYRVQKPFYIVSDVEFTLQDIIINQDTEYTGLPVAYQYRVLTDPNSGGKQNEVTSILNYMIEDLQEQYMLTINLESVFYHEKDFKAEINMSFSSIISKE
ncbi:MAG: hypothetical protein ACLFR2_03255 [Candidatus Kapaibacterium sp.]